MQHHAGDIRPPFAGAAPLFIKHWAPRLLGGRVQTAAPMEADAHGLQRAGLQLQRGELRQALVSWRAIAFGLVTILLLTPWVGAAVLRAPLQPPELAVGLAVFCAMPTSLSANIALAAVRIGHWQWQWPTAHRARAVGRLEQEAIIHPIPPLHVIAPSDRRNVSVVTAAQDVGANTAMSLLLTAASNIAAVFTMPFLLAAILGGAAAVSFEPRTMVRGLVMSVLLPLAIGVCLRSLQPVRLPAGLCPGHHVSYVRPLQDLVHCAVWPQRPARALWASNRWLAGLCHLELVRGFVGREKGGAHA